MPLDPQDTCWTVVRAASQGDRAARSAFGRIYAGTIRGFFNARWSGRILRTEIDDAVQEVFLECLKPDGVLDRATPERGDFRGLLFGVSRNVARRFEERASARGPLLLDDSAWLAELASDEAGQETLFDRDWAKTMMRQSRSRQRELALADGEAGLRRIELLERRFQDNEPIRNIAKRWGVPAQEVHQVYRMARDEFYRCLREVVGRHSRQGADLDSECHRLLSLLG